MYHYMTKKKGSFALLMILLVAEGVAGVFFSLVMSSLVDSAGKSGGDLLMALAGGIAYTIVYILLMIGYHCHKASLIADARCCLKGDIFSSEPAVSFVVPRVTNARASIRTSISGCTAIQIAAAAPKDTTHSNTPMMFSKQTPSNRFKLLLSPLMYSPLFLFL